jgi:hypothetical protein
MSVIHVPSQSITIDKSMEITNSRNNTLNDVLIQSKHYSASSRKGILFINLQKDAIIGMKEFFSSHPHLFEVQMGTILETMSRLMVDEVQLFHFNLDRTWELENSYWDSLKNIYQL